MGHFQKHFKYNTAKIITFLMFYLFLRERHTYTHRVQAGEGQKERETKNLKEAPGSELSAQSLTWGSNP